MSLTKYTKDTAIIQQLDDEPNDVGGMTSAEVKAAFDQNAGNLKSFLNDTMTAEIDTALGGKTEKTTTVNGHALSENVTVSKADVGLSNADNTADVDKPVSVAQKAALDKKADVDAVLSKTNVTPYLPTGNYHPATKGYVDQIAGSVVLGQLPDGTVTEAKMTDDVKEKLNGPRVPTAHASTHHTGGADALAPGDIGAAAASHNHDSAYAAKTHAATHKTGGSDAIAPGDIGACAIATVTYTGTGTYGDSNPTTIVFPFAPKLVTITSTDISVSPPAPTANATLFDLTDVKEASYTPRAVFNGGNGYKSSDGKTLYLFASDAANQFNLATHVYIVQAIG